jgi:hypothetical protein
LATEFPNWLLLGYWMLTLDPDRLAAIEIPVGTGWLLGACIEARGKQDLWMRRTPEVLDVLREQAAIQKRRIVQPNWGDHRCGEPAWSHRDRS